MLSCRVCRECAQKLFNDGYSATDIITTLFRIVRNADLQEWIKLEYIKVPFMLHPARAATCLMPLLAWTCCAEAYMPLCCVPPMWATLPGHGETLWRAATGDRLLPHPHQRWRELPAAAVRAAGEALQAHAAGSTIELHVFRGVMHVVLKPRVAVKLGEQMFWSSSLGRRACPSTQ